MYPTKSSGAWSRFQHLKRNRPTLVALLSAFCCALVLTVLPLFTAYAQDRNPTAATGSNTVPTTETVDIVRIEEQAIKNATSFVAPSVVKIETVGGSERNTAHASGICVSADGYFLTAAYNLRGNPSSIFLKIASRPTPVDSAADITAKPNSNDSPQTAVEVRRFIASVVATDHSRHIVLLKTQPQADFPFYPINVADTSSAKVGQTVIAVGKVYDQQRPNLSVGIVSAFGRIWGRAIQTDAKISRANYGGPLINLFGEAIGILCPLSHTDDSMEAGVEWYDSGIGFAIPLDRYRRMIDLMVTEKDLHIGLLGVAFESQDIYADTPVVGYCHPKSPAEKAGVKTGDLFLAVGGKPVKNQAEMKHALGPLLADDQVTLTVKRDDETLELTARLAKEIAPFTELGLGVVPAYSNSAAGTPADLTIQHVIESGPAAEAGIAAGAAVQTIDGHAVKSWEVLESLLLGHDDGDTVEVKLSVAGETQPNKGDDDADVGSTTEPVTVTLGPVSAVPPKGLPRLTKDDDGQSKIVEITSSESSNGCYAIVPDNDFDVLGPPALFVWLAQPGVSDPEKMLTTVGSVCRRNNVVVLVPQSLNPKMWTPGEQDFIVKAIQRLDSRIPFDASRVAIGGDQTAGTMACLTALTHRDTFRGLIMFNSLAPRRLPQFQTRLNQRLLVYLGAAKQFPATEQLGLLEKTLTEKKFPVYRHQGGASNLTELLPEITAWVRTLNRK